MAQNAPGLFFRLWYIQCTYRAMNETLITLERTIGLGATYAARLLGVAYPTYAQYRSGRRELPLYHQRHIELPAQLQKRGRLLCAQFCARCLVTILQQRSAAEQSLPGRGQ